MRKVALAVIPITFLFEGVGHSATLTPSPPVAEALAPQNLKTSTSPGWTSRCASETRKAPLVCSVEETVVLANTGQVVASVAVRTQPDGGQPVMSIRIPVGFYLPAGLSFKIDDGKPQPVPLQTCDLQGCYAEMPLSANLLATLKAGKQLSLICQNTEKKEIVMQLALGNFAEAFEKIQ